MNTSSGENRAEVEKALREWSATLGPDKVTADKGMLERFARTTLLRGTHPACVLYPTSTVEVQTVVRVASAHGVVLFPISRGKNWGYGDACAPQDGAAIVDLSRMNRILEVNTELAYAVIEPGVSQQQLFDYLREHNTGLRMDCTGAGADASLVGNLLERGFGHTRYGDHFASCCGMEVVLADGRVLHTGFGHYRDAKAAQLYRYGVGPFLDGLFSQANLGIVTQIGLWLMPEPEAFCCFAIAVDRTEDIGPLVDRLRPLRLAGVLNVPVHIGNDLRVLSARTHYPWQELGGRTPLPPPVQERMRKEAGIGAWNAAGAFTGTKGHVRASRKALRKAMKGLGRLRFVNDRLFALGEWWVRRAAVLGLGKQLDAQLAALRPVYDLLKGIPNNEALHGAQWRLRRPPPHPPGDPLERGCGLIWASPVIPQTGRDAMRVMTVVEPILERYAFEPLVTFTLISERAMIAILSVPFDKTDPEEGRRAEACYHALLDVLMAEGYPPYRVSIEGMDRLWRDSEVFWDVARQIKRALDPKDIIARGRYISPLGHEPMSRTDRGAEES